MNLQKLVHNLIPQNVYITTPKFVNSEILMINFRRLALVSGIAVLSAVAVTPKAQAQSANIDFTSNVPATCSINSTTNGIFALNTPNYLDASSTLGTPGNINVSCTNGTTFTITSIADNGSTLSGGTYASNIDNTTAKIRDGGTEILRGDVSPNGSYTGAPTTVAINTPSAVQSGPITNKNYTVEMYIARPSAPLLTGTYKVRVGITLTPQ
jgi:Spore Coat Protein U domain